MSESKQQVSGAAREALRESLSAAVDGEATQLELRRVLNAMGKRRGSACRVGTRAPRRCRRARRGPVSRRARSSLAA